jgi:hypothetical protein
MLQHRRSSQRWNPLMTWVLVAPLPLLLASCATAEFGRQITSEEVTWITKGVTTRSEVVQRFGAPRFELPDWTSRKYQTTTTQKTVKEGDTSTTTTTTVQVEPTNKTTKAVYMYTKSEAAVIPFYANVKTVQEQFWVIYDENGIVQDFGFTGGPGMTVR